MAKVVVMPKLGLTMTEGTVSKWLKKVGDAVSEGEPLFEKRRLLRPCASACGMMTSSQVHTVATATSSPRTAI